MLDAFYLAALCAVTPGLGRSRIPKLIKFFGNAKTVYEAQMYDLLQSGICTVRQIENFIANRRPELPEKLFAFCSRHCVKLITIYDADYPEALKEIQDFPLVLYVRGVLPVSKYNLAIVGSREASPYGLKAAGMFAAAFAQERIPVISGGARGIDTAAHKACLLAGGSTVAVLGCGIDIAYPSENKRLFEQIADSGALVSEFAPGTAPRSYNFPARNRIIVGMSRGVLVAEAARKSGAIITAGIAADEAREVYCIPGNIFTGSSIGCHDLIRTGAKLVDGPQDIFEDMREWYRSCSGKIIQPEMFGSDDDGQKEDPCAGDFCTKEMSALGKKLFHLLLQGPLSLEELTEQSGESFADVSMELLNLQVEGIIAADQAQRYYRI